MRPRVLRRVAETISRYRMFEPGYRVGVAVSGGADSVCLLHVLLELAPRWNLALSILHLDHGLRGEESRQDARFVAGLAAGLGLPLYQETADVRAQAETDNLEQAARKTRYAFFRRVLEDGPLDRVAVGHTRSDQAETVLFRFLRGAGTAGLAGIRPVTAGGVVRPLLALKRAEVEEWLRERGIRWREDSSNADPAFARNRIRCQLLPQLEKDWNPALVSTLANTADWALAEEAWWEAEIARLAAEHLVAEPPAVLMRTDVLRGLPLAVARRLARRAVESVRGDLRGIDFPHIQGLLDLAAGGEGHGRLQLPGVDAMRSFEWLRLVPWGLETLANRNYRLALSVPGAAVLPDGSRIVAELIDNTIFTGLFDSVYNERVGCLDRDRISGSVEVRNWRPGDRYQPGGHPGEERIKLLFQQARIPLWERRHWPLVTLGDAIIWAKGFGAAVAFQAGSETRTVLRIRHDRKVNG